MGTLPVRAQTAKAEAISLLNDAFNARLLAHRARPRSEFMAGLYTARADDLMKAARALETAAQEIRP
jgi:hypothetical protein